MYRIGEVSRLVNVSVQSIHLYQRKGLLSPTFTDEVTGYRYYDENSVEKIFQIKLLQKANFTLNEIVKLLDMRDDEKLSLIKIKRNELNEKIEMLVKVNKFLKRQEEAFKLIKTNELLDKIVIKNLPNRYGRFVNSVENISYEEHIQQIKEVVGSEEPGDEIYYQSSLILKYDGYRFEVAGLLAIKDNYEDNDELYCINSSRFACILIRGNSEVGQQKLIKFCLENNFKIKGYAVELLLLDSGVFVEPKDALIEIQIAIE